jgi:NADPH-dependent 2,4-dienoyl-CoA reductase/sulfur reductase-like enzyme
MQCFISKELPPTSLTAFWIIFDPRSMTMTSVSGVLCDTVIIGAGHKGLTVASYLARAGNFTAGMSR